jgi:plastocyanin
MPGDHDASLDNGAAFKEFFGDTHYSFDHKGVHFIVLDNVSDPAAKVGEAQLGWLQQDLAKLSKTQPIVVFTHRPLFDLYPDWDWATRDGKAVIDALMPYQHVTVFYGHIHQEHNHMTGHIAHHAARSLIFPLPAPGSQPKPAGAVGCLRPLQGVGMALHRGRGEAGRLQGGRASRRKSLRNSSLGIMTMRRRLMRAALLAALVTGSAATVFAAHDKKADEQHVSMVAMKFDYLPDEVTVKKGKPVVLELTTLDRLHGFDAPTLGLDTQIQPGPPTILRFTPKKAGVYGIHCDIFCGDGHEGMAGRIIVTD